MASNVREPRGRGGSRSGLGAAAAAGGGGRRRAAAGGGGRGHI
jgi:hypothetical protein